MKRGTFFQQYPLISYFVLVYLISWGGSFLVGWSKFRHGEPLTFNDAMIMGPVMIIAPALVGILMALLVDGRKGIRELFTRMRKWRVDGRWYLALLIFPALILILLFLLAALIAPELTPNFFATGILAGLLAGFFEEIGWTGFAFPKMKAKGTPLGVGILLGFIHAAWHTLADYLGNSTAFGEYWLPYFAGFFFFVVALRVLIVWVYVNTRSLMLAQLMHASSTGFLAILVPIGVPALNWAIFYPIYATVLWLMVVILIARYGKTLMLQVG